MTGAWQRLADDAESMATDYTTVYESEEQYVADVRTVLAERDRLKEALGKARTWLVPYLDQYLGGLSEHQSATRLAAQIDDLLKAPE